MDFKQLFIGFASDIVGVLCLSTIGATMLFLFIVSAIVLGGVGIEIF